jgi:iron-sulfur cluster insertion protein
MVFTMLKNYNINLTENALKKIRAIVEQEKTQGSILRIAVSGGGCSGFKYDFLIDQLSLEDDYDDDLNDENDDFEEEDEEEDDDDDYECSSVKEKYTVISDYNGNPVLMVDNYSAEFLKGSVIDYIEDLSGSGFQIKNELAKSRCGCGNSFSI